MAKNNIIQTRVSNRTNYYIEEICKVELITVAEYIRAALEEKIKNDIVKFEIKEIREFE
jgi:hypothetical protein